MGPGIIEAGGIVMSTFVRSISGFVGGQVIARRLVWRADAI